MPKAATAPKSSPPPDIVVRMTHATEAEDGPSVLAQAERAREILTPVHYRQTHELRRNVRALRDRITEHYKRLLAPFRQAIASAKGMEAEDLAPVDRALGLLNTSLQTYDDQQEALKRAERDRRQAEADARAKVEQEQRAQALRDAAAEAASKAAKSSLLKQAREIESMPVYAGPVDPATLETVTPAVQNVSKVVRWKGRVTEPVKLMTRAATPLVLRDVIQRALVKVDQLADVSSPQKARLHNILSSIALEMAADAPPVSVLKIHEPEVTELARQHREMLNTKDWGCEAYQESHYADRNR